MKKAVLTLIAALIVMMGAIGFGRNLRNDETVLAKWGPAITEQQQMTGTEWLETDLS